MRRTRFEGVHWREDRCQGPDRPLEQQKSTRNAISSRTNVSCSNGNTRLADLKVKKDIVIKQKRHKFVSTNEKPKPPEETGSPEGVLPTHHLVTQSPGECSVAPSTRLTVRLISPVTPLFTITPPTNVTHPGLSLWCRNGPGPQEASVGSF